MTTTAGLALALLIALSILLYVLTITRPQVLRNPAIDYLFAISWGVWVVVVGIVLYREAGEVRAYSKPAVLFGCAIAALMVLRARGFDPAWVSTIIQLAMLLVFADTLLRVRRLRSRERGE
jgi:hypothetical protein